MTHTQNYFSLFQKTPPILLPLAALILSISMSNLWYQENISLFTLVIFYNISALALAISAHYLAVSRTTITLIIIALASGFARTIQINHSYRSFIFQKKPITIRGKVVNKVKNEQSHMNLCITLQLISVKTNTEFYKTNHSIQIYTQQNNNIEVGDILEIYDVQMKKPNNKNFWSYLIKEGITTTIFVPKLDYTQLHRPTYSLRRWFHTYKNNLLTSFQQQLSPPTLHLFSSLFLGTKNKKNLEFVNKQFKYWGILHYLARSGLHLAVVITIYEAIFKMIPFPFMIKHLIFLLLGGIYFLLSWPSISFIRAFLMFLGYKLSALSKIQSHFLHTLFITCCIVLLVNPMQLFFIDFQLSFCLTFALGWLNLYRAD